MLGQTRAGPRTWASTVLYIARPCIGWFELETQHAFAFRCVERLHKIQHDPELDFYPCVCVCVCRVVMGRTMHSCGLCILRKSLTSAFVQGERGFARELTCGGSCASCCASGRSSVSGSASASRSASAGAASSCRSCLASLASSWSSRCRPRASRLGGSGAQLRGAFQRGRWGGSPLELAPIRCSAISLAAPASLRNELALASAGIAPSAQYACAHDTALSFFAVDHPVSMVLTPALQS